MNEFDEYEAEGFMILDPIADLDENLAEVCYKVTEWWMEDYTFEQLLEEFNVLPEEAFYTIVKAGLVDPEDLKSYLTSDR